MVFFLFFWKKYATFSNRFLLLSVQSESSISCYWSIVTEDPSFWRSFWIRIAFPFIIHLGMLAFFRHYWINVMDECDFFYIRMHVFLHSLMFSNLLLSWVFLLVSSSVCLPQSRLQVLGIFFFHVIYPFGLSVLIFYCKVVWFPLHPSVLSFSADLVAEVFFCYFGKSYFICIAWPYPSIFWVSLPISF